MKKYGLPFLLLFLSTAVFAIPTAKQVQNHGTTTVAKLYSMQQRARNGNRFEQAKLGQAYLDGVIGMLPNYQRASYWLHKAAKKGSSLACANLATMYRTGSGVPQNQEKAKKYYTVAYNGFLKNLKNNKYKKDQLPLIQYKLANIYFWGEEGIVKQDLPKAFQLYKASANHGFVLSIQRLSNMYHFGLGTKVNEKKAFELTKILADNGIAQSQFFTGKDFILGITVKKDMEKGLAYLKSSARHHYIPAIQTLLTLQKRGIIKSISSTHRAGWAYIYKEMVRQHPGIMAR